MLSSENLEEYFARFLREKRRKIIFPRPLKITHSLWKKGVFRVYVLITKMNEEKYRQMSIIMPELCHLGGRQQDHLLHWF